jgi:hypothetical protein
MRRKSRVINILFVLIFLLALGAGAQGPAGAPPSGPGAPAGSGPAKIEIASISFKGNTKFKDDELLKAVGLKVGEPLSQEIAHQALDKLIAYYRSHGANLSVSPNIDPNGGHANVQFVIDENGTKGDAGAFQPGGGAPPSGSPPPAEK